MDQVKFETKTVPEKTPSENEAPTVESENKATPTELETKTNSKDQVMSKKSKKSGLSNITIAIIMVVAGIVTGFGIYSVTASSSSESQAATTTTPTAADEVTVGETYGAHNGETFTDEAEGVLVKGGVGGEGSHHLLREGGPSKNVYLTSSILDLTLFEGHKVRVWGETFQAQQAGWLMDAGKVEVLELNSQPPFEEEPLEE